MGASSCNAFLLVYWGCGVGSRYGWPGRSGKRAPLRTSSSTPPPPAVQSPGRAAPRFNMRPSKAPRSATGTTCSNKLRSFLPSTIGDTQIPSLASETGASLAHLTLLTRSPLTQLPITTPRSILALTAPRSAQQPTTNTRHLMRHFRSTTVKTRTVIGPVTTAERPMHAGLLPSHSLHVGSTTLPPCLAPTPSPALH